jgi:tetratricopeptide (TPR) repeat protein
MAETRAESGPFGFASLEALLLWLPGQSVAVAKAIRSLYLANEFDRADAIAGPAIRLFPDEPEVWFQYAMVAMHRPDQATAVDRFQATRERFPEHAPAYGFGGMALRYLGRVEDAAALLEDAIAKFPGDWRCLVEYAQCASTRGPVAVAVGRWETVRSRFPDRPEGYWMGGAEELRAGRLDAAETLIELGRAKYPDDRYVLLQWARVATERRDWPEAERRFAFAKQHYPDWPMLDEGLRTLQLAAQPDDRTAFLEYAREGTQNATREEAIRRWELVRNRFPEIADGHWMLANELVRVGRLDAAEAIIDEAADRFPDQHFVLWQWARTATQRHDWPEAQRRWDIAKARFPDWQQIDEGIAEMRLATSLLRTEGAAVAAALPEQSGGAPADAATGELLLQFESLGDNCEFGIVQRMAGVEPLGLLRWANITPAKLIEALDARFAGVGEPAKTRLWVTEYGEYHLIGYYFGMHTFINAGQESAEHLMPKILRRLRFLKDKLIDDLTNGDKIFVYKNLGDRLGADGMRAIHAAMRRYGNATLLCVQPAETPEQDGRVEFIANGLYAGYLSKVTKNPQAVRGYVADWFELCRTVLRLSGRELPAVEFRQLA